MSLKTPSHSLSIGIACVGGGGVICCWWTFFSFFFLFSPKNYSLILFGVDISTSVLIILISNFFWLFCKIIFGFQFHPSVQIYDIIFTNLILIVLISKFLSWPFLYKFYPSGSKFVGILLRLRTLLSSNLLESC